MGGIRQGRLGVPPDCQPLKTGQTTQYSSKEDDGYFEKGKAKKYVVLTAGQHSGTVNIVLNAKTHALSNNCVVDKKTGLMWARYVPDGDIGPGNDGKLLWLDDANDEDIFDFKDQANVKQLGGYSDWRAPNIGELLSLLVYAVSAGPCIDTATFPSLPNGVFLTSTTSPEDTAKYVAVYMNNTVISRLPKATAANYCFLVRGPK